MARPDVKIGDRWTYRRMDYETNTPRGRYEDRGEYSGEELVDYKIQ